MRIPVTGNIIMYWFFNLFDFSYDWRLTARFKLATIFPSSPCPEKVFSIIWGKCWETNVGWQRNWHTMSNTRKVITDNNTIIIMYLGYIQAITLPCLPNILSSWENIQIWNEVWSWGVNTKQQTASGRSNSSRLLLWMEVVAIWSEYFD